VLATAAAATAVMPAARSEVTAANNADTTADSALQEVVVTGSRLSQAPNDVSISPVTSITNIDIQQTGLVRVEDLLNNLPSVAAENSSGQSISSNGTATVALRGLGSQRTLVLVDSFRMTPGAGLGTYSQPDLNQIPADLIERVDVLTGGASSVYGADAVAGVVNFVLNTHFEGVQLDANYGFAHHKNNNGDVLADLAARNDQLPGSSVNAGYNKDVSFLAGSNFADGKGNATVYFTYLNTSPVEGYQYDYSGCTLNTPGTLPGKGNLACGGSSSSATGRFLDFGPTFSTTIADSTVQKGTGKFIPYVSARDSYNYGALSYLQRQAERYTAGSFLHYDFNDNVEAYSEFMFSRNTSQAAYGPSGLFAFGTPTISCSNPLLNASELATLCSPAAIKANQTLFGGTGNNITLYAARRSVESGPRLDNYSSNGYHEVLGVKGKFADAFSYNVYAQVGVSQLADNQGGYLGVQQINNALNVISGPALLPNGSKNPLAGQPECASKYNGTDTACVPWNIWNPGGVTQAALNYLTVASTYGVTAQEYVTHADISGDLGKYGLRLPTANNGLSVNAGAEYRQEHYDLAPDYIFANGFASGGNGAQSAINAGFHVSEIFTEFRLPIFDEKPGAYELAFEGGYRYSSYTSGFDTNTFKLGVEWAPIQSLRLRGGYNRAIRAPSIGDLYAPAVIGSGGSADPCWGPAVNGLVQGHSLAFCENTGVTAAEFGHILANPAAQINTTGGGNTALKPEIADTYTVGFVVQPTGLSNFVASVDYYEIHIKDTIESLSSTTVIDDCGATGDKSLCSLINRGAGTGSLWFNNSDFVNTQEHNLGINSTRGIDLTSHYRLGIGAWGKLNFTLAGTEVINFLNQPIIGGGSYDCAGYFGTTCNNTGAPVPHWRHVFGTSWATPWEGLDVTARWRYIGPLDTDRSSQNPQMIQTYFAPTSHIGGYSYLDLSASIPLAASGVSVRVGVNNLLDKAPPIVANGNYSDCPNASCNDNTFVGMYDTLGRYMYAHVSAKF
jgi:outer membrane receptor protein involved in Fe transport